MAQTAIKPILDPAKQKVCRTRSFSTLPSAREPANPEHSPPLIRSHHHPRPRKKGVSYPCLIVPKMVREGTCLDDEARISLKEKLYEMYLSSEMSAVDGLEDKAIEAVDGIITGLPNLHDQAVLLAASAWVAVLRDVNEALRLLSCDDAINFLTECTTIFEAALQVEGSTASVGKDFDSACCVHDQAVVSFLRVFLSHAKDLLSQPVFVDFIVSCTRVWQSKKLEFLHRRRGGITEADYLDLHNYTPGFGPLFILLLSTFHCRDLPDGPRTLLNRMIQDVRTATLLQLDLVGLKNDIKSGETFNYVLLQGNEPGSSIVEWRRTKAIAIHNDAVGSAIDCWNRIRGGDWNVKSCAECLLHLLEQYYRWRGRMTEDKGYESPE